MAKKSQNTPWMTWQNILAAAVVVFVLMYIIFANNSEPKAPVDRSLPEKTNTLAPEADTTTPVPSPVTVTPAPSPIISPETDTTTSTGEINPYVIGSTETMSGSGVTSTGALSSTGVTTYFNTALKYGFSLPKGAYYAGFGAQDGAAHTVGVLTGTGVESFSGAEVRVWFYPTKYLPELAPSESGFYQDPSSNMTYLKLGKGTIRIEGDMESPIVNMIIQTVNRETE